jgi:hypothetical protein
MREVAEYLARIKQAKDKNTEGDVDRLDEYLAKLMCITGRDDIPRFSPKDGRLDATVLFFQQDPGRSGASSSGIVDRDNDGPTARNFKEANDGVLDRKLAISWNIVPWPLGERSVSDQIDEALPRHDELLGLLRNLRVVVLLGDIAGSNKVLSWLYRKYPHLHVLRGPHPVLSYSNREERRAWLEASVKKAATLIEDHKVPSS